MNKIKCDYCKKKIEFEDSKIKTNKYMEFLICPKCSRTLIIKDKKGRYYETEL